jgi:PTS system ascorbate-specific IIC component
LLGKVFGNKEKSTEDIKFPKQIEFLREITITSSLVMFIVYMIVGLLIGGDQVDKIFGDKSLVTFSLLQGVLFGAGLNDSFTRCSYDAIRNYPSI